MARKSILLAAVLVLSGLGTGWAGSVAAQEHRNPADPVSNPETLNFPNVIIGLEDLTERFQRDGTVHEPQFFSKIRPGMTSESIRSLLGSPLLQTSSDVREWNYNFKFRMEKSENYIVCQYKVLFDTDGLVKEVVWRRRQCQNINSSY